MERRGRAAGTYSPWWRYLAAAILIIDGATVAFYGPILPIPQWRVELPVLGGIPLVPLLGYLTLGAALAIGTRSIAVLLETVVPAFVVFALAFRCETQVDRGRVAGTHLLALVLIAGCASSGPSGLPPSSASATISPRPSSPAPPAPPKPPSWQEVARLEGSAYDLVAFSGGYVVLGQPSSYSADGRSWQAIDLDVGSPARSNSGVLVSDGVRLLAAGGYEHEPCAEHQAPGSGPRCAISPIVWVSSDGTTWISGRPTNRSGETPDEIVSAWPDGNGGWEAALASWEGEALSGNTVWHSADGLSWSVGPQVPVVWEVGSPIARIDGSGRRILVADGYGGTPDASVTVSRVVTSTDGRQWSVVAAFPAPGSVIESALAPGAGAGRWLLGGRVDSTPTDPNTELQASATPTIWSSRDGVHWSAASLPAAHSNAADPWLGFHDSVMAIAESPFGYVAIVSRHSARGATYETWIGADATSWSLLAPSPSGSAFAPISLAVGPAGVLAIGMPEDDGHSLVWELR